MSITADRLNDARLQLLRSATARDPGQIDLRFELAERLIEAGHVQEGVELFRATYLRAPALRPSFVVESDFVSTAQRCGRIARHLIEGGVCFSSVLAALAWSAAIEGRAEEARWLIDYRRFFFERDNAFPSLFSKRFAQALIGEIRAGMQSHDLPWTAIRRASRNSRVLDAETPACRALASHIRSAVDEFVRALPEDDHPFCRSRPAEYTIKGWTVTFDGSSRHINHIHPRAWLSGVFYVAPAPISLGDPDHRGWFRAGPPVEVGPDSGWDERWVEPTAGKLAMMPAYFAHETTATGTDESRICVAFDVMPLELAPEVP